MINILIHKQSNFPVSSVKIKHALSEFFTKQGIVSLADVNVSLLGKDAMERLGKKYLSKNERVHNVLSFTVSETKEKFKNPPDDILHLGDIAICYPVAVKEAGEEGVLVEEKVIELLIHGAYHLLGKHHE